MYFKYTEAWRSAFFSMMEIEDPLEVPCKGRENLEKWIYQPHPSLTNEQHTNTPNIP